MRVDSLVLKACRFHNAKAVRGVTLTEVLIAIFVLTIAMAAIISGFMGQLTINEHARNLALALNDAARVMESIRQQNSLCSSGASPTIVPLNNFPTGPYTSWDDWLAANGRNMSSPGNPNPFNEKVLVTCLRLDNAVACGQSQIGSTEWNYLSAPSALSAVLPTFQVTVAVCWRHRNRTIGECSWNAGTATLSAADSASTPNGTASVIDSPAMINSVITCRAFQ